MFLCAALVTLKPELQNLLIEESIKAIPTAVLALISALLAWGVGSSVALYWAVRQKRRETELSTLAELYRLYGEFVAVWKLWNQHLAAETHLRAPKNDAWPLLERAAMMEAGMEAVLVKIASERRLNVSEIKTLGLMRQAFQSLREHIRENRKLDWWYSGHKQYLELKSLTAHISNMLLSNRRYRRIKPPRAWQQLRVITNNYHEKRWADLAAPGTSEVYVLAVGVQIR